MRASYLLGIFQTCVFEKKKNQKGGRGGTGVGRRREDEREEEREREKRERGTNSLVSGAFLKCLQWREVPKLNLWSSVQVFHKAGRKLVT